MLKTNLTPSTPWGLNVKPKLNTTQRAIFHKITAKASKMRNFDHFTLSEYLNMEMRV